MKKTLVVVALIAAISLIGCAKKSNKTTVIKTPEGKTVTTVTSPEGHIISRTVK
jgi:outer membrane lipoprotein SlyB